MATQSLRILEGTENWLSRKQSIEDLGLFLKGQRFDGLRKDIMTNRSESAPPSMEGSIAALEHILSWRTSNFNPVSADNSKAEDCMLLPMGNLDVHIEEEVEDDISSEMSGSLTVEKAVLLNHNEDAFDLMQEDSQQTSLPSYQYCSSSHKSTDKTVNLEGGPRLVDGKRRTLVRPPPIETHSNIVNLDPKDDLLTTMVSNKDVAHIQSGIMGVSFSSASNYDYHKMQHEMQAFSDNNMQQLVSPQQGNPYQFQGSQLIDAYSSNNVHYGSSVRPILQSSGFTPPLYASAASLMASTNPFYHSLLPGGYYASQYGVGGYTVHPAVLGISTQPPLSDPFHMQYMRQPLQDSYGAYGHFGRLTPRDDAIMGQLNACDPKNHPQLIAYSTNQNFVHPSVAGYNILSPSRGNASSFGSPTNVGPYIQFPISQSPVISPNWGGANTFSFLEDLKLGKGQKYKLCDIAGRVAEVSVDQHGSRFIQQKLEICSAEEKESLFKEVVLNASKLMTDVFGNYVIQKFFEYGTPKQRKDLANQLTNQIVPLSLQMYGCRVIQKALEVIDIEQKIKLVRELDGHVITCVLDQNGNHVIQKCIESTPAANIGFIISSFRGEVVTLSMHPYGCRVIQRVLERCNEELQTQFIVDEILESVCTLIQDQYGNYVTQHVLERGKPHERSQIISKITGSVVQLSQHKFASNVVEKCLEYGDSTAREMLIKEIIGHGDKNDNLLIMMKDQYANYVIQKILQKCCDNQKEVLLGLIRNHLTALKKYTYGKHIVARFEHLCEQEIQISES